MEARLTWWCGVNPNLTDLNISSLNPIRPPVRLDRPGQVGRSQKETQFETGHRSTFLCNAPD